VDQADRIIQHVGADKVIALGDVFDDFNDTPVIVTHTCEWFINFVNNPDHIFLMGNHSIHYAYPYSAFQCSGYAQWKYFLINDIVSRDDWDKLKWYHFLDGRWLLSHGGLHKFNLPEEITKFKNDRPKFISEISGYLDHEILEGLRNGATNQRSWIFSAGHSRGGCNRVGGIIWCDHNEEMYPIIGMNQIYGHSPQTYGSASWLIKDSDISQPYFMLSKDFKFKLENIDNVNKSTNLCLDVWGNTHWGIWNGKTLTIGNYKDL
jgi:hypothetical protein